jgi:hypothetical protein
MIDLKNGELARRIAQPGSSFAALTQCGMMPTASVQIHGHSSLICLALP